MNSVLGSSTAATATMVQDSVLDQRGLQSIRAMKGEQTPEAMREVAKKFEGMLLQQMLKTMRESNEVIAEGSYLSSNEEKFHRDMMDQQLVLNLTSGRGIGLADHFYKGMMGNYEKNTIAKTSGVAGELKPAGPKAMSLGAEPTAPMALANNNGREFFLNGALASGVLKSNNSLKNEASAGVPLKETNVIASLEKELAALMNNASKDASRHVRYPGEADAEAADNAWLGDHFTAEAGFTGKSPFVNYQDTLMGSGIRRADASASSNVYLLGKKQAQFKSQQEFVNQIRPHAEEAAKELNVNPNVLIAQAALETGWGKHVIHTKQGDNSFNLFNIKASGKWQGDSVNVPTLEYKQGIGQYENAQFRKYSSYSDSFSDYVKLIKNNDRYQPALAVSDSPEKYADALQTAGYATDPNYAQKIKKLLKSEAITAASSLTQISHTVLSLAANKASRLME